MHCILYNCWKTESGRKENVLPLGWSRAYRNQDHIYTLKNKIRFQSTSRCLRVNTNTNAYTVTIWRLIILYSFLCFIENTFFYLTIFILILSMILYLNISNAAICFKCITAKYQKKIKVDLVNCNKWLQMQQMLQMQIIKSIWYCKSRW